MVHLWRERPSHAGGKLRHELQCCVSRCRDEVFRNATQGIFPHITIYDFACLKVLLRQVLYAASVIGSARKGGLILP